MGISGLSVSVVMQTHVMELPVGSFCADIASWGCLELGCEYCNWGQIIFTHHVLQASAILFCVAIPLHVWAVDAPSHFHITKTAQRQKRTNYSETNYVTMGPLEVLNILLIVIKWLWFRNVTPEWIWSKIQLQTTQFAQDSNTLRVFTTLGWLQVTYLVFVDVFNLGVLIRWVMYYIFTIPYQYASAHSW